MAHYAFLDENNVVTDIITGVHETDLIDGVEPETWYQNFRKQKCKRASYNTRRGEHILGGTPFRYNYPTVGYTFDEAFGPDGAFVPPKPNEFPSWILHSESCWWVPPIPHPAIADPLDTTDYIWNEENESWVEFVGEPMPEQLDK